MMMRRYVDGDEEGNDQAPEDNPEQPAEDEEEEENGDHKYLEELDESPSNANQSSQRISENG